MRIENTEWVCTVCLIFTAVSHKNKTAPGGVRTHNSKSPTLKDTLSECAIRVSIQMCAIYCFMLGSYGILLQCFDLFRYLY